MSRYKLKRPTMGIDQLSDETNLRSDDRKWITSIRNGVNIDIDREGNISRREGYELKKAGLGYHSLYQSDRGWLLVCNKNSLNIYEPTTNTLTQLALMDVASLTSFAELNGNIYYMNIGSKGLIRKGEVAPRTLGVSLPDVTPDFAAVAAGGLQGGQYGVAYTLVNELGEESPLGPLMVLNVSEGGGIQGSLFTVIPGYTYRIYLTAADGDELYQAVEFDADATSYLITTHQMGRKPATQFLSHLPYGYTIRAHNSRLYVACDDFVFFSEPFAPHLTNQAHGFIPTTGFTSMLQPIEGGVYIGDANGVRFYKGDDPSEFEVIDASTETPVFNTAIAVPGEYLPGDLGEVDAAAVWLSSSGYNIGTPDGKVVRMHADRVKLPNYTQGCSVLSIKDGRKQLITPVNSNELANVSVALDSSIC